MSTPEIFGLIMSAAALFFSILILIFLVQLVKAIRTQEISLDIPSLLEQNKEPMKEFLNTAIQDKVTGMTLTAKKEEKLLQESLIRDMLNTRTDGLWTLAETSFPSYTKRLYKMVNNFLKTSGLELNDLPQEWIDKALSIIDMIPTDLLKRNKANISGSTFENFR